MSRLIEQGFGWAKTVGRMRQVMVRGLKKVDQMFVLNMTVPCAIFVMEQRGEREVVVSLAQLVPVGADRNTREAVADLDCLQDQGYSV